MVIDHFQGQKIPRYLVYDIIKYDGKDIQNNDSYSSRLKCIKKYIVGKFHLFNYFFKFSFNAFLSNVLQMPELKQ